MALTPDEIRSREFHLADRGYDRAEVQAFLAEVAAQVASGGAPSPWAVTEERLVLILDAARRAVDAVREEATRALRTVGERAGEPPAAPGAAPPATAVPERPVPAATDVDDLRHRLAAALAEVEAAIGAIEPAGQRTEPSTRPSS